MRIVRWIVVVLLLVGGSEVWGEDVGWPRQIDAPKGKVVIYQPQLETFQDDKLTARAAVAVTPVDATEPVFGAVWFACRVLTDRDERTVTILDLKVPKVKFPNATPEQEKELSEFLETGIPHWDMTLSLDRLLTGLERVEKEQGAAAELRNTPPTILYSKVPAVLVTVDGPPKLHAMDNSSLMKVVNTPFAIVLDPGTKAYYLRGEDAWYSATNFSGPWTLAARPPAAVAATTTAPAAEKKKTGPAPRIIVATTPTELIVSDGEPDYTPLVGAELLYMSNTESDVLMEVATGRVYILLSGRWFRAKSLNGPWEFVPSDKLPKSFAQIPADSDKGHLLASVAGTSQARDAVMDNAIPQTAAIDRKTAQLDVTYDGDPEFENVSGTDVDYAVNTADAVLKIRDRYYACHEGVWFFSDDPTGPWVVSGIAPSEVQALPPSCPVYNVKYVTVYESTPEVVYVGYTPAYLGSYVYGGTVVWGTGYVYAGWYGHYYYPRPATWGFHAWYNPWTGGWGFGVAASHGFFRAGSVWGHDWYWGGWWGPGGYHGFHGVTANRVYAGRNINVTQNNIYNRQDIHSWRADANRVRNVERTRVSAKVENNVFADHNGYVYRRTSDGWQRREGDAWARSDFGNNALRDREALSPRSSAYSPDRPRSSYRGHSSLDDDFRAREHGTARTGDYQRARSFGEGRSYPRGGGFRRR